MRSITLVTAIALAGAMSACSTTSNTTSTPATDGTKAAAPRQADASKTAGNAQASVQASAIGSALPKDRSVYFAYDDSSIPQDYLPLIEKHGKYLMASPSAKVKIEGNADERGSAEYNLALGQKRAEATMKALRLWGVRPSQMEATSWGEERPKDKSHEETAYSQNRRADIVYAAP